MTVTVSLPTGRAVVGRLARPLLSSVTVPSVVDPVWKVTVPAGIPAPDAVVVTVAVKVTVWPNTEGLAGLTATVVVVVAGVTTWVTVPELAAKVVSPA